MGYFSPTRGETTKNCGIIKVFIDCNFYAITYNTRGNLMTTLFIIIMSLGDVSQGKLDKNSALQFVALGAIGDLITSTAAVAIWVNA